MTSTAWLDAFGLNWIGAGGGAPVNLRPGPVWRDTLAGRVVPRLPGQWLARDYDLVRLPVLAVMCVVLPGRSGGHAAIYPLYIPERYGTLQFAVNVPSAVIDAAPEPVEPLLQELTDQALPFFDRYGHPAGLRQLCRERSTGLPARLVNPHDLRCLAASEVMLGEYIDAATTYAALAAAVADHPQPWTRDIEEEARVRSRLLHHDPALVHEALTATIRRQMSHVGLPPSA